jgi:hypothetical protein
LNDLRIKLAACWFFIAGAMLANTLLYFVVPGVIDEIRAGVMVGMQTGPELILGMAIVYFGISLVMATISLTIKDKVNRLVNLILGGFYSVFVSVELTMNVSTVAYPYAILMDVSMIAVAALIAWTAWKWR